MGPGMDAPVWLVIDTGCVTPPKLGVNPPNDTGSCDVTSRAPQAFAPGAVCVTENVFPAMVTVPERAPPVFAVAWTITAALPAPEAPEVTLSHPAFLVAVHEQPAGAVTTTLESPPFAANAATEGAIEYEQLKPDSLMLYCWPPTVMKPLRGDPALLAATT